MEAPALAPRKALKVSTSSTAQWVVEAQAAVQHGVASARADPKEPVAQGESAEVAMEQVVDEAPRSSEADVAKARALEVDVVSAGAPGTTEAEVVAQGAKMEAAQASVPPPI